jgi:hypothetical protein
MPEPSFDQLPVRRRHRPHRPHRGIAVRYDGRDFISRMALARELATTTGRSVAVLYQLIVACEDNSEAVRRALEDGPRLSHAIPTTCAGQTFPSRRALFRHLSELLGVPFDTIHARFYALHGDVEAIVYQFQGACFAHGSGPGTRAEMTALLTEKLSPLSDLVLEMGAALKRVSAELSRSTAERRVLRERMDQMLRVQAETRRGLGQLELHQAPRHSRRRPLGHD